MCRIAGTGPCARHAECCSNVCINKICCLHDQTCKMSEDTVTVSLSRADTQSRVIIRIKIVLICGDLFISSIDLILLYLCFIGGRLST